MLVSTRRKSSLYVILAVAVIFITTGCTKKESPVVDIENSVLLKSLPQNTSGLMYWNTELNGYKKYKQSPWASSQIPLDSLDQPELQKVISVLNRIGLLNTGSTNIDPVREGVLFIANDNTPNVKMIDFGLYVKGKDKVDLVQYINKARAELSKEGIAVKDISGPVYSGIEIDLVSPLPIYPKKFFITAKGENFAAASSSQIIDGFYSNNPTNPAKAEILNSSEFKTLFSDKDSAFILGLLNYENVKVIATKVVGDKDQQKSIMDLPLHYITYTRRFKNTLVDDVSVGFNPINDKDKLALRALNNSENTNLLKSTPEESLFSLQIDGKTLSELSKNGDYPDTLPQALAPIKRVAITSRGGTAGSLFPELTVIIESNNSHQLSETISEQLTHFAQASGFPFSPWKEEVIEQNKIKYSLTPLGVGVYIGVINNNVVASTTKEGISTIALLNKNGKSLYESLKSKGADSSSTDTTASGYVNFIRIADTLDELQGTLAMFSGGNADINVETTNKLKALGAMNFLVRYSDQVIRISTTYHK